MATYTVNYSEVESLAMNYAAMDVNAWIQNAAHDRARIAIEEIIQICVPKYLAAGIQMPVSSLDIVKDGYERGWIKTAARRNQEAMDMNRE
jgi:hypothetical protein